MDFNINELPLETFIEILRRTDGETLGKCRQVCKKWKECIDSTDLIWHEFCQRDFKYSSKIAKQKSRNDCKWYHIYKNLKKWSDISNAEINVKLFFTFSQHNKNHALPINYSVLPLKDANGIVLYDMNTLKYIPVAVPETKCIKIANNNTATVLLIKTRLLLERSVKNASNMTSAVFKADDFVLTKDVLYYCYNREVYKSDLTSNDLSSKLIANIDYHTKEIQHFNDTLYLFSECGKIVSIKNEIDIEVKPINIPVEWIKQIKHINAIDDKNFVCYSRNLFKIETNKYKHLYLDFPPITALFFYGDIVLIGTNGGEILLYRLSSQKTATKPIFERLAVLPDSKYPVQLDVCERKTGPVIVAATFFEIYLLDVNFFPHEAEKKISFPENKLLMYKRFLKLREKLRFRN